MHDANKHGNSGGLLLSREQDFTLEIQEKDRVRGSVTACMHAQHEEGPRFKALNERRKGGERRSNGDSDLQLGFHAMLLTTVLGSIRDP